MGSCLCKKSCRDRDRSRTRSTNSSRVTTTPPQTSHSHPRYNERVSSLNVLNVPPRSNTIHNPGYWEELATSGSENDVAQDVKALIRETLSVIRDLVNNDQEPPSSLMKLNLVSDKEEGWQLVVRCLIDAIPDNDALGPAVMTLFLDESPLPSREAVSRLICRLGLGTSRYETQTSGWHRNACIVLGSLAEKMAGASSAALCSPSTLHYLMGNLCASRDTEVVLFSLIALEKFAQTTENRLMILRSLEEKHANPLEALERWLDDPVRVKDPLCRQVGFCAQWSLDNIFVSDSRTYSCMVTDVSHINAMLNHADVSEYLKIGPDGLQARCDVSSFESVRCTFEVPRNRKGIWYYEATVLTGGVMQIGFATKKSRFLNHEGYGIGDDEHSVAYDGCRQLIWHAARGKKHFQTAWSPGDVVGCLLDMKKGVVIFSLNGVPVSDSHRDFFSSVGPSDGVFAAASFMSFQASLSILQCVFNFGASPFRFPPTGAHFSFNEGGASLSQEEKTILPRRRRVEMLAREPTVDNACTICCSRPADTITVPCMHGGLCEECALQVENCPFCRKPVQVRVPASSVSSGGETVQIHTTV